jgi:hypothetical protein
VGQVEERRAEVVDEKVMLEALLDYKRERVLPARAEFEAAARARFLGEIDGNKYMRALEAYAGRVIEALGAPESGAAQTATSDSAERRGPQAELDWIESEKSRVLDYYGGILSGC